MAAKTFWLLREAVRVEIRGRGIEVPGDGSSDRLRSAEPGGAGTLGGRLRRFVTHRRPGHVTRATVRSISAPGSLEGEDSETPSPVGRECTEETVSESLGEGTTRMVAAVAGTANSCDVLTVIRALAANAVAPKIPPTLSV